jgi:hypothetical protein
VLHLIEEFAVGLTYLVQGAARLGTGFTTVFYGIKTVILGVQTAIVGLAAANVAVVTGMVDLASKIPGVGTALSGVKTKGDELRGTLVGMTVSLAKQTAEAAGQAAGNNKLAQTFMGIENGAVAVRKAIEPLIGQEVKLAEEHKKSTKTIVDGENDRVTVTQKDAKKIEEIKGQLEAQLAKLTTSGRAQQLAAAKAEMDAEMLKIAEFAKKAPADYKVMSDQIVKIYEIKKGRINAIEDDVEKKVRELTERQAEDVSNGVKRQMAALDAKKQKELADIAQWESTNKAAYDRMRALIEEHYKHEEQVASGAYTNLDDMTQRNGIKTREVMQQTADNQKRLWLDMVQSGEFTTGQLKDQWEKYRKAQAELDGTYYMSAEQLQEKTVALAKTAITTFFGHSKAAAIAQAIIDAYAAFNATLKSGPMWLTLASAGIALATGLAQVAKMKSQNIGFAQGTPNLDFAPFGVETPTTLHGAEAVIPQGRGHMLAAEIAAALPGGGPGGGGDVVAAIHAMRQALPRQIGRAVRDAMLLAPA